MVLRGGKKPRDSSGSVLIHAWSVNEVPSSPKLPPMSTKPFPEMSIFQRRPR